MNHAKLLRIAQREAGHLRRSLGKKRGREVAWERAAAATRHNVHALWLLVADLLAPTPEQPREDDERAWAAVWA